MACLAVWLLKKIYIYIRPNKPRHEKINKIKNDKHELIEIEQDNKNDTKNRLFGLNSLSIMKLRIPKWHFSIFKALGLTLVNF